MRLVRETNLTLTLIYGILDANELSLKAFLSLSVLATLILVVDITLVVVELAVGEDNLPVAAEELFEILALLFSAYFCAEVSLRIIGQG